MVWLAWQSNLQKFERIWRKLMLTKKYSHNLKESYFFFWWECLGLWVWETASQELWENCSKKEGREVRLQTSLQQRKQAIWTSKIRCQVKEFNILCLGRCKPLGSLNSVLSNEPQLSGANPLSWLTLPLAFPSYCGGWQHLLDHSLGSPHSHMEARHCWWLWHFLFIDMAGHIFISHDPTWRMCMYSWSTVVSDSVIPWTEAHWAPPSVGFSRQEYWSGLPFPSQDRPNPGVELVSLMSPALADRFFTTESPGKPT